MIKSNELFVSMNQHLLTDIAPSDYLNKISVLPEFNSYPFNMLLELKKSKQSPKHHPEGNVWNHTMLVVDEAAQQKHKSKNATAFMWASLLHDIGKPSTTKIRKGRITSYDHDKVGAELAKEFLASLNATRSLIESVCELIKFHMHILFVVNNLPFGDLEALKQHADIEEIALLGLCDRLGRTGSNVTEEEKNIELFLSKIKR
jgi:putative nucleotidyltransferase with HDIG domain